LLKGLYTNLLNRKEFECPAYENEIKSARFRDVQELFEMEIGNPFKYAHRLNHKVLHPNAIERVNVELACHFYSESTESALVHFSEEFGKDWLSTSRFIRLVCQFFNTVNNKSLFKAVQKRDASRKPVTKENRSQLNFLAAFLSWVQQWQAKQWKKVLSRETFCALLPCLLQTVRGLRELANYLLDRLASRFTWQN